MLGCGARGEDDDATMTPLPNSPEDSARRPLPSRALPSGALFNLLLPVLGLAATTMLLATVAVMLGWHAEQMLELLSGLVPEYRFRVKGLAFWMSPMRPVLLQAALP